jgi:hypothetical protein
VLCRNEAFSEAIWAALSDYVAIANCLTRTISALDLCLHQLQTFLSEDSSSKFIFEATLFNPPLVLVIRNLDFCNAQFHTKRCLTFSNLLS